MKLYFASGACSLASHIALYELELPHEIEKVDLRKHVTKAGEDYYAINPKGYVPALKLDDGEVLTENPAVLQYLADLKPDSALAPAHGTQERYRLQEWLAFVNSEIHKNFSVFFKPDSTDAEKVSARERLSKRFDWIQSTLRGRTFLMGDSFTVADAYLYTVLNWCGAAGIDLGKWPELQAYQARIAGRPTVKAAQDAEKAA